MKPFSLFHRPRFPTELLKLNSAIKRITTLFFIYDLGWGIVAPLFTLYISTLFGNYKTVGILAAALEFFALLFGLFLGPLLDKLEKRSLISTTLFLYLPFTPLLFALSTLTQLILFRVYHAAIASGLWLTGEAYVREHSEPQKEAQSIGLFDFGVGASQVLGGLLGAALVVTLGFNLIYAVSIFGGIAFIVSLSLPDKTKRKSLASSINAFSIKSLKQSILHFKHNKQATKLLLYAFPYYFVAAMLPLMIPLFVKSIGGSLSLACLASALFYVPMLFESYFCIAKNQKQVFTIALISGLVLFILLSFVITSILPIFLLTLALGVTFAAIAPNISGHLTQLLNKKKIGEQTSVIFAVKSLAAATGLITAGFVADGFGLKYVFMIGALAFIILLIFKHKIEL